MNTVMTKKKDTISDAANLLLRANTKFLQGDIPACRDLTASALKMVKKLKSTTDNSNDIQLIDKQLAILYQMVSLPEYARLNDEKKPLPIKIKAQVDLLRACISRGNIKASKENLNKIMNVLPPDIRFHPDILEIEKIIQNESDK
jgi:hypothetical protein